MVKQANLRKTLANQVGRIKDHFKSTVYHDGKFNPIQAMPRAIKKGYDSTAVATGGAKKKNMVADALEHMLRGNATSDVATGMKSGNKATQYLRDKGWLSVGRQTVGEYDAEQQKAIRKFLESKGAIRKNQGTLGMMQSEINEKMSQEQLQKILNEARQKFKPTKPVGIGNRLQDAAYNVLPGEKSLLVGGAGLGMAGELAHKETEGGRKKSLAERIGRAGTVGATEALVAPLGVARKFGLLGGVAEQAAVGVPTVAGEIGDRLIDKKRAMSKTASYFESLPPSQKAILMDRLYKGYGDFGFSPSAENEVSFLDSINPTKLRQNYRKHKKQQDNRLNHMAKKMFSKEASIPKNPRNNIRRLLK